MKATITLTYSKIMTDALNNIAKKYASIDSQAQLIVSTITGTGNSVLLEQKTLEITNTTKQ